MIAYGISRSAIDAVQFAHQIGVASPLQQQRLAPGRAAVSIARAASPTLTPSQPRTVPAVVSQPATSAPAPSYAPTPGLPDLSPFTGGGGGAMVAPAESGAEVAVRKMPLWRWFVLVGGVVAVAGGAVYFMNRKRR